MTLNKKIELPNKPDQKLSVTEVFDIDSKLYVKGFQNKSDWVPDIDNSYVFDRGYICLLPSGIISTIFFIEPVVAGAPYGIPKQI